MKGTAYLLSAVAVWHSAVNAAPHPTRTEPEIDDRDVVGDVLDGVVGGLGNLVSGLLEQISDAVKAGDRDGVLSAMHKLKPTQTPTSVEDASKIVEVLATSTTPSLPEYNAHLIANGIISGTVEDLFNYADGLVSEENSSDNSNPDPKEKVYPKKSSCDAPYSTSESDLRSAIYIPDTFTYGDKPPVVLFPGTGATGYTSFAGNLIPLLSSVDWADPVWVNVPHFLGDDAQVNAEYAAYAMNYIASLTGNDVAIVAWSQGNIDTQWALKYWPSTRKVTTDHIAISPDYKGSLLADIVYPVGILNTPSVLQQQYMSEFIKTMRSDGGDSGYIPTTSIYSGFFDEIVEPQSGESASAYLLDARGVGVENVEVQVACKGHLGGSLYTHEGMLANPLTFALIKDALAHKGPGMTSRLDLAEVCEPYLAPGLGLDEFLLTENAILIAGLSLGLYLPKELKEPEIMHYATMSSGSC